MQHLIDVRNQLDRYAAPDRVDWHLACINNRWTKRALASAGFGFPTPQGDAAGFERWKPVFSVAEIGGAHSAAAAAEYDINEKELKRQRAEDQMRNRGIKIEPIAHGLETASSGSGSDLGGKGITARVAAIHGLNKPLFHTDLTSALQSAIANVELRGEGGTRGLAKGVGTEGV